MDVNVLLLPLGGGLWKPLLRMRSEQVSLELEMSENNCPDARPGSREAVGFGFGMKLR